MVRLLVFLISFTVRVLRAVIRSRANLVIENVALRQQVATLIKQRRRPALDNADRAFWVALRAAWPNWTNALVIVEADTVAKWHRERFRRHWAMISRQRYSGRPRIDATIRDFIREMATNGWGAPRIHGELKKLGFEVSEATVSRYMPRLPADPDQLKRWVVFLRNHKGVIAAMDLFTVPTASLRVLYGFFVIDHSRRRILHFNATFNPTSAWVIQHLREAFPFDTVPKYLIFDRDAIFSAKVVGFVKAMGIKPCRTAYRSPWQNGVAERWIGSCRRELLDHLIVFDRHHFIRVIRSYLDYYHEDRCHLGLAIDAPSGRIVTSRASSEANIVVLPRVGDLHHRYAWRDAA